MVYTMGKRKAESESDVDEDTASEDEFMASEGVFCSALMHEVSCNSQDLAFALMT